MLALAATQPSIGPILLVLLLGVLVTFGGHLTNSRRAVAIGIFVIFLATVLMFALGFGAYRRDAT
ncbi:MAG: hypothetical protein ACSLFR_10910 [Solirubrobacteraceae bacterium]